MANNNMDRLQELQGHSGKRLCQTVLHILRDANEPMSLVRQKLVANGNFSTIPKKDISQRDGWFSIRKTRSIPVTGEDHNVFRLNTELLGGTSYPLLTTALGVGAGFAGVGLLFTAATTGINMATKTQRVLVRPGDEIWHVEQIGKVRSLGSFKAVYVSAFFVVDPYRKQALTKGWLIHEDRLDLDIG